MDRRALLLLSGGLGSTVTAFWARDYFDEVHALTVDYGQRHQRELLAAEKVAKMAGVSSHEVLDLSVAGLFKGSSPLTGAGEVPHYSSVEDVDRRGGAGVFVPGRNLLLVALAANRAYLLSCRYVLLGMTEVHPGGTYPDSRQAFLAEASRACCYALHGDFTSLRVESPVARSSKADIVRLALTLPGCTDALAYSHSCYDGEYPPNPRNRASIARAVAFRDAGVPDPLIERAKREGRLPPDYPASGYVGELP